MNKENKIIIRFFSSFCSGDDCKSYYESIINKTVMKNYGLDKKIYITNEDDYTHVIILNTEMPTIKTCIPIKNVIGLAFEPIYFLGITPEFIEYAKKNISRYFIGDKKNLPEPFVEHVTYMWHTTYLTIEPIKKNLISIMVSQKTFAPGHKYRHELVNAILQTNLPVDIYGRGCKNYNKEDSRLKGEFNDKEPYENYLFHISIENFKCNEYFSEKIINPLLCSAIPIYCGCHNITNYFDDVICLTGNLTNDLNIIINIINEPMKYYKQPNIEKIKNETNLLYNIDKLFS